MALLAWPAGLCPQAMTWSLYGAKNRFPSLNGKVQEKPNATPKWRVSMTFEDTQRELSALEVLIDQLKTGDTVAVPNFRRLAIAGITGTPRLNGQALPGKSFQVNNFTGTIKAGDFFQIGGELKRVTADRNGPGLLHFVPATRQTYATLTNLIIAAPNCAFTLASDETGSLITAPGWDSIGIDLVEFV